MKRNLIVVFDDGETFNDLVGCTIMEVSDEGLDLLNEGEYPKNLDSSMIIAEVEISEFMRNTQDPDYGNWDRAIA